MRRKLGLLIAFSVIAALMLVIGVYAQKDIRVQVDNETLTFDTAPYIENDRVMAPVRGIAEKLGGKVTWDPKEETVWIKKYKMSIQIPVGKKEIYIHREDDFTGIPETVRLDAAVKEVNGRVVMPLRILAERLDADVSWDEESFTVQIKHRGDAPDIGAAIPFEDSNINDATPGKALRDMGINISAENVSKIEMFSLVGKKVKEYSKEETASIINSIFDSRINDMAHIEMITGNTMVITMTDASVIRLASYGSNSSFVMSGQIGSKSAAYHLTNPDIAKLLLDKNP